MTNYAAHIITADAAGLGDPSIEIMTQEDDSGPGEPIISYPLAGDSDPITALRAEGWLVRGEGSEVDTGYSVVDVEPISWDALTKDVTFQRGVAQAEMDRCDNAWRTVIRDAMNSDLTNKTQLAESAGISRERAYQIRDGRR